jgi:PAS domain S-box-containing protein
VTECVARFSAASLPVDFDEQIETALTGVMHVLHADRCVLLGAEPGERRSWVLSAASDHDECVAPTDLASGFPWLFERLRLPTDTTTALRVDDLPADAVQDRESARALSVQSMLTIGVHDELGHAHCLLIQSKIDVGWSADDISLLRILTRVLVNAWERRHVDVLESVGVILWRADARTFQITFVSREVEAMLGYPAEMWVKVPGFWRDHIHPDDRDRVMGYMAKAVEERRSHELEYRMVVGHGRVLWLRNIVKVIADGDDAVALVGATLDVTERKRAEFEVEQLRHQLMHAGRVTTLGELAATLAHELNQPLGAIVSNAETALMDATRQRATVRLRGILHDIERDAQRAGEIVHRVRQLIRRSDVERQPFDADRVVSAVVALVEPLARSRHIDLKVNLAPGLHLHGDVVQIQQLLLNVILNAIDAVTDQPEGSRQIVVRGRDRGGEVVMAVSDTGRGVDPELLPQLFAPFFTTRPGGLGMGLAICRTIVHAHGGDIRLRNKPRGGVTVSFTLRTRGEREAER